MRNKKITIGYNKKKKKIPVKECNLFGKSIGLMFSRRETAENLLFNFKKKNEIAIHSFFVFHDFLAIWLDEKNNVVDIKIVKPFTAYISSRKPAYKLIEIPMNKNNRNIISFFRR